MSSYSDTRAMRLQQVERCLDSGMPIKEWCKLNHVSSSTLYVWLKVYREESRGDARSNGDWIELTRQEVKGSKALAVKSGAERAVGPAASAKPVAASPDALPAIRISLNGAEVAIPSGMDGATIKSALSAVASL